MWQGKYSMKMVMSKTQTKKQSSPVKSTNLHIGADTLWLKQSEKPSEENKKKEQAYLTSAWPCTQYKLV